MAGYNNTGYPIGFGNFEIISGGHVDEKRVRELVSEGLQSDENKAVIRDIAVDFKELYDDTKVYNTYSEMILSEPTGRKDVLYVITTDEQGRGTRYIWENGEYVPIQDTIEKSDIDNIVQ